MQIKLLIVFSLAFIVNAKQSSIDNLECPVFDPNIITICDVKCFSDEECAQDEKCCHFGCRIICQKACPKPVCDCKYGVQNYTENSCRKCKCIEYNPCAAILCSANSICVFDPITKEAKCVPLSRGECPQLDKNAIGTCVEKCSSDDDCLFNEKCCSNGCGHVCKVACPEPVCDCKYGTTYYYENKCKKCKCEENPCSLIDCKSNYVCKVDPVTKLAKCVLSVHPGICPEVPKGVFWICNKTCSDDTDCATNEKCCRRGCRTDCLKACPELACKCPYGTKIVVENNCKKCVCVNPCDTVKCDKGYYCKVNPVTLKANCVPIVKAGSCPVVSTPQKCLPIPSSCLIDFDCPDTQKCCSDSCRNTCVEPCVKDVSECKCDIGIPTLVSPPGLKNCKRCSCENPCGYKRCPSGQFCVNKEIVCVKAPCRPVAECVTNHCKVGVELLNVFCGRGPNRQNCSLGYSCLIAPNDAYAVCCPNRDLCKDACKLGERCVLQPVQCLIPPCPMVPKCLPECPMYKCVSQDCPYGLAFDKNGCRTCDCFIQ